MKLAFLLFALALLGGCSWAPRVESAAPTGKGTVRKVSSLQWPEALSPPRVDLDVKGPDEPVPKGRFGKCEVIMIDRSEEGMVLFHVGRLAGASPVIGATATFRHAAPRDTTVTLSVEDGSFAVMSLIYPAHTPRVKGHVIYVGTMAMLSRPEQRFIERLRDLGWHVATIVPLSSMSEFQRLALDPALRQSRGFEAAPEVAGLIDRHLASQAYAVESLVAYLKREEPGILDGRRVVIGGSMGSLSVPALVARVGSVDAMILVAGGGNMSRIIHESRLGIFAPDQDVLLGEGPGGPMFANRREGELASLKAAVFEQTHLDPLHVAPTIAEVRALLLTANGDRIVPRANADLLHEAMNKPERWHYPLGHVALFLRLPYQANRIEAWMAAPPPGR